MRDRYSAMLTEAPVVLLAAALGGCGTPLAKLTYLQLAQADDGVVGYPFVVPRTVVKVVPAEKSGVTESVAFTPVPLTTRPDGTPLATFLATGQPQAWSVIATSVSAVQYTDDLVISTIGTQATDNRKDALDAILATAGLAIRAQGEAVDCATRGVPLKPFIIDVYPVPTPQMVPGTDCWAYTVQRLDPAPPLRSYQVATLPSAAPVPWFPIPACQAYRIRVFHCADPECHERADVKSYTAVLPLSDGTAYRRIPLPSKGKITLHPDFCGADITDATTGTSNWSLLKQAIADVKAELGRK